MKIRRERERETFLEQENRKEFVWPQCSAVQRNLAERVPEMGIKQHPDKEQ